MNLITCVITWLLLRVSMVECTIDEVKQKQYVPDGSLFLIPDDISDIPPEKFDFVKDKNKEVKERRDKVDTKARTLLTLTSLLLGLLSSTTSFVSAKSLGIFSFLPLGLLFITLFLLTVYLGINRTGTPDISYIFLDSDESESKKTLCNAFLTSQDYNQRVTDFMVDLYGSALRYFSLGMLLIMVLGSYNIISANHKWIFN